MKIFDTHAHYDDRAFDADRDALLGGELFDSTGIVNFANIGCDMKTSRMSLEIAENDERVYAVIGVIPHHVAEMTENDIDELRAMAASPKVVAIGEIGLDYYYDEPAKDLQHKWFLKQMELAKELGLPIVIHSRDAAQDTYELMKQAHAEEIGGVVHCYSYSEEMAREFLKMGFYFGIGGVVTFKNAKKLKRAVQAIPLDKIVLETDAPYLTPSPFRGERNDSRYLPYVVEEIARLKEITPEEVAEATYENARRLYRINE
ncbi:MAG: TatD family hydrolase [Eubacterium sp.]|nr:TatD family hydrolase [Eubacterium sp.]